MGRGLEEECGERLALKEKGELQLHLGGCVMGPPPVAQHRMIGERLWLRSAGFPFSLPDCGCF